MKLSKELAIQAKSKGICTAWYSELLNLQSKDAMVDMYLKGIDFCLSNDFPQNDFIRKHFKGAMEKKGVYLDDTINVENKPKCVCLGAANGRIVATDYQVCEIYAKHNSDLTVIAKDNAFVVIDIFDYAKVDIRASDRAKVCVYHYGGIVNQYMTDEAIIKIRKKDKKTY